MTTPGNEASVGATAEERGDAHGLGRVSFLEQALWKQFAEATSIPEFVRAWLALQCTLLPGVERGVVVLGESDTGPYAPVAHWPLAGITSETLNAVAELALTERRGVAQGQDEGSAAASQPWCIAYPLIVEDKLYGVAALEFDAGRRNHLRQSMRQLQWGVGWIEVMLRREHGRNDRAAQNRMATAFDLVAAALEKDRFRDACNATVTELANRLDCDQTSIGFLKGGKIAVAAISHLAQFARRMNLVRAVGDAMNEAVDQQAIVAYPAPQEWGYRIDRAARELARANGGSILTIPLHARGKCFGALTFERPPGTTFDEETITLCDCVANIVGPVLEEKRKNDRLIVTKVFESIWTQIKRLFGPHYIGRKLATAAAVAVVGFFSYATMDYAVVAPASLEGSVQRSIVAPFDGYIASQAVRAGDIVHAGDVMATLDDKDLVIERLKWSTKKSEYEKEYGKALSKQERAEASIIQVQVEQAKAQLELLDEQIKRTRLIAPFDALVISGDLSQSIGAAVKRGDELLQLAPLDSYRVILKVDERDIADVKSGQSGALLVSSIPVEPLHYKVTRVTPIAEVDEGVNSFRVEAALSETSDRLRPGMKGVGKTTVEPRLMIDIWTRRLIQWLRITLWRWLP